MFLIDQILLMTGVLCLVAIWSSKLSARFGVPVLVLCLLIGMLAGSEGIGGIEFNSYGLAHGIGTAALAVILFDGGLRTSFETVRMAWKPAFMLATVGVLLTALITGAATSWLIGIPLLQGLLLGSIISSTDAAAVFAILKKQGLRLKERLSAVLEFESGSNDPMAILMTIACIQLVSGESEGAGSIVLLFVKQLGIGGLVGAVAGVLGTKFINSINLDTPGFYPILAGALGLISFGLAAQLGGSGFLAVYLTGIILGDGQVVFRRGTYVFYDGAAWLGQIVMFIVLGLLVFPSSLADIAVEALLVAVILTFVARPITVFVCMAFFRFSFRELVFLSWVGLKGAVPIILGTYPALFAVGESNIIFDVVFFVVVLSALTQGWSLPLVARKLKLDEGMLAEPPVTLELNSLRYVESDIVEYQISEDSPLVGLPLADIPLPERVLVAMIAREKQVVPPSGRTRLQEGDYIFAVVHQDVRGLADCVFEGPRSVAPVPSHNPFTVRATVTVGQLKSFYGIVLAAPEEQTLGELLEERLERPFAKEDFIRLGDWSLGVRRLSEKQEIITVYLSRGSW